MSGFVLPTPMPAVTNGNGNGEQGASTAAHLGYASEGVATSPTIGGEVVDPAEIAAEV